MLQMDPLWSFDILGRNEVDHLWPQVTETIANEKELVISHGMCHGNQNLL